MQAVILKEKPIFASTSYDLVLRSLSQTQALADTLAPHLSVGDVLLLVGTLGAGKTELARSLIQTLGYPEDVPSPTFNLVLVYQPEGAQDDRIPVWHFDLYRLESADEIDELGYDEALDEAISLIEWPDRLGDRLPEDFLKIELIITGETGHRLARLTGYGAWQARLDELADRQGWDAVEGDVL